MNFSEYLSLMIIEPHGWFLGFSFTVLLFYFVKHNRRHKKGIKSKSSFVILMTDFWFDESFTRKIVSFVYFLALVLFNSTVISSFTNSSAQILSPAERLGIAFFRIFIVIVLLLGVRIILELIVSNNQVVEKVSENNRIIRNYINEIDARRSGVIPGNIQQDECVSDEYNQRTETPGNDIDNQQEE